jgi:hypothetical protein
MKRSRIDCSTGRQRWMNTVSIWYQALKEIAKDGLLALSGFMGGLITCFGVRPFTRAPSSN